MSDDYIIFLKYLPDFLKAEEEFISFNESKWNSYFLEKKKDINCPIMQLKYKDNVIEIFKLHYQTEKEAKEKWDRRKKRVNFENMIVKMSEQNNFSSKNLKDFENLNFKNKICFTCSSIYEGKSVIMPIKYDVRKDIDINDEPRVKTKKFNLIEFINKA